MTRPSHPVWARAELALRLALADPSGLGGILLRARSGPVRDRFISLLPEETRRIHPAIPDDALFGGLDVNSTLTSGRAVYSAGLCVHHGPLMLSTAERATPAFAARIARLMAHSDAPAIIVLDEGIDPDETTPPALSDRLAFHIDFGQLTLRDVGKTHLSAGGPRSRAIANLRDIEQIEHVARALGVVSLRASAFALRAAQVSAALAGRTSVANDDIEAAIALVLVPRATQVPQSEADDPPPQPDTPPPENNEQGGNEDIDRLPDDMLIEAAKALLPPDLLDRLAAQKQRAARGNGSGASRSGNRRGRPLPSRAGRLDGRARLDLIATLRQAAPWQRLRRLAQPKRLGVIVRPSDIHLHRHEEKSDRLLIFVVDASGSAAMTRLAEAKGAVEIMLATAYARRDHVSLVAFRGESAQLLLPPTRSLVRTKRMLAALPGGGATPMAHGLREALSVVKLARQKGMTPTIALLTDGRANVALDGTPNRTQAALDALQLAKLLHAANADSVVIDMGRRPEPALANLARSMGGQYLALPVANARSISAAVSKTLDS